MTEAAEATLATLTQAVHTLLRQHGTRLTRAELCARLRITPRTLHRMLSTQSIPAPTPDGHWLLADVMAWEESTKGKT